MAKSDRPEDETPPRSVKRRRRPPPVLELQATEVGGEEARTGKEKPRAKTGAAASPGPDHGNQWRERLAATASGGALVALAAGAVGAIAGALLVYLLVATPRQAVDPRIGELTGQVAGLSAKIETLAARPSAAPAADQRLLADRIEKLTAAIGEAEQRLAAVEKRPMPQTPDLSAVNQRTVAIESALKDLRGALGELRRAAEAAPAAATPAAVESVASRIGGLEERIAALAAARASAPAETSALVAQLVALNALASVVQSGKPFAGELAAARTRLGDRAAALAPLEPLAAKGVPTAAALSERFAMLAPDLLRGPELKDGFFSRLVSNASRLVEVRPVGEPEGTSVGAVVARMETKLGRGDVAGALTDAEILPEAAKIRAAEWISLARQRHDAVQLVQKQIDLSLADSAEKAKP